MENFILVVSYLLGGIPFALLVGKIGYGVDVRTMGSGNLGSTNVFRNLGKKAGTIVLVGDIGKGVLATLLPLLLGVDVHLLLAGMMAVIGHSFSPFVRFKGGKSVATAAGVFLAYAPIPLLIALAVFFLVLKKWKYVSLASMVASSILFLSSFFKGDVAFIVTSFVVCLFLIYRHRSNIQRIANGTEPKVKWI